VSRPTSHSPLHFSLSRPFVLGPMKTVTAYALRRTTSPPGGRPSLTVHFAMTRSRWPITPLPHFGHASFAPLCLVSFRVSRFSRRPPPLVSIISLSIPIPCYISLPFRFSLSTPASHVRMPHFARSVYRVPTPRELRSRAQRRRNLAFRNSRDCRLSFVRHCSRLFRQSLSSPFPDCSSLLVPLPIFPLSRRTS
jgi:hypothetical protein